MQNPLILLGPPGCGKGTQAKRLVTTLDLVHLSTGEILREEVAAGTTLGNQIAEVINQGNFVSDEIMIELIRERLRQPGTGAILDGFPRTVPQAEALDLMLTQLGGKIEHVIYLEVDPDETVRRIGIRAAANPGSVREDDKDPETIRRRLSVYESKTKPLVEYYRTLGVLKTIPNGNTIEKVHEAILNTILDRSHN